MSRELTPDLPLTFAARSSGSIHLQLQLPLLPEPLPAGSAVRLRRGSEQAEAAARSVPGAQGHLLVADVPAAGLTDGSWRLQLRPGSEGAWQALSAYLLLAPDGPVSLLLGSPAGAGLISPRRPTRAQRAAHTVGRGLDVVLTPLGPERARTARTWLRRTSRRLLP